MFLGFRLDTLARHMLYQLRASIYNKDNYEWGTEGRDSKIMIRHTVIVEKKEWDRFFVIDRELECLATCALLPACI